MYYDTHRAKICKDIYRPSNIVRFAKSLLAILIMGQSPIAQSPTKHRLHQR